MHALTASPVLAQGRDAGGSLTPSSAGDSAGAFQRLCFDACRAAEHAAAAAAQQPGEGPAAKRARVLLGETGLPLLPAALALQSIGVSAGPTEQVRRGPNAP